MAKTIKNLSNIEDSTVSEIVQALGLKNIYSTIIVVNPDMNKFGDIQFAFKEQMCFVSLKNAEDISTLAHELRHLWQMEQLGAELYEILYLEEMSHGSYESNVLEIDAFEWEQNFMQLFHLHSRVA